MNSWNETELENMILLLLIFVVGFGILANRLKIAYPIVLVIAGLVMSLIPGLPRYNLTPDIVFVVFLPPLIFAGAYNTSWRDLKVNFEPIFLLAVGLVGFTTLGVALAASMFIHGFDWKLGLILGAIVSPTDIISVLSIAKKLGVQHRIIGIIEGESLLNDASGLLAMEFAIALMITGVTPTILGSGFQFIYMIAAGVISGLIIGKLVHFIEHRIDHTPIEIIISLLAPYLAYLLAEQMEASNIISVVACGLYLGRYSSIFYSSKTRLSMVVVWDAVTYVLNGIVFLLLGMQLPIIYNAIGGSQRHDWGDLMIHALIFCLSILLIRIVWIYFSAKISYSIRRVIFRETNTKIPNAKSIFIIGWAGMRGVLSLAAALSIPLTLNNGAPFPHREEIIFMAFCVILFSLVVQGLTLPMFIRRFGFATPTEMLDEVKHAKDIIHQAGVEFIDAKRRNDDPEYNELYDHIFHAYSSRILLLKDMREENKQAARFRHKYISIATELRMIERSKAIELRNQNQISHRTLKSLENEIDLAEEHLQTLF